MKHCSDPLQALDNNIQPHLSLFLSQIKCDLDISIFYNYLHPVPASHIPAAPVG